MLHLNLRKIFLLFLLNFLVIQCSIADQITLYTSVPNNDLVSLIHEFNKHYPNTKVVTFRSGTVEVQKKLIAEKYSGKIHADIVMISDHLMMERLKSENMLSEIKEIDLSKLPSGTVDKDKTYLGTKFIKIGFLMHKGKSQQIKRWSQLLHQDSINYKVIIPNPEYSGAAQYTLDMLSQDNRFGPEFANRLKNNAHMVMGNEQVTQMVAQRPNSIGIVVDFMALKKIKKDDHLVFYYPEDLAVYITEPIAIINTTKNRAEALNFVNFVLSKEGQLCFQQLGYTPLYIN